MRFTVEMLSIMVGLLGLAALAVHEACQLYTGDAFTHTPTNTVVVADGDDAGADE
jgi:hypothetical protein